jgi:hypothetical protein
VAKNEWAPAHDVVNVAVTINIEEKRPLAAMNNERFSAHRSECSDWRVDPAERSRFIVTILDNGAAPIKNQVPATNA